MQKFLHIDNTKCQISNLNKNIKPFYNCLLRKGIEVNKEQSFIACIADLFQDYNDGNIPNIKQMKTIITESLSIDLFIKYHNGNLVAIFKSKDINEIKDIDVTLYSESKIYSKIDFKNNEQKYYYQTVISSLNNFKKYLLDDNINIDHVYLWDIVSIPNPKLFINGLNLIILEIPDEDITDNIDLICPTNHYSNEFYNSRKKTVIIMLKDSFYEPLYVYRDDETKIVVQKTYSEFDTYILPNIKSIIHIIKNIISNKCKPLNSIPNIYEFKMNYNFDIIYKKLSDIKFTIEYQVVNYNNKVIGLMIRNSNLNKEGFIPILPSPIRSNFEIKFIDDDEIWKDYATTMSFLNYINEYSEQEILSKPLVKIIEDELIVGILTETNQFVKIDPPNQNLTDDGLKSMYETDYVDFEKRIMNPDNIDKERVGFVKKIRLENKFYNVFRNTTRLLLNKYENIHIKKQLELIFNDKSITYKDKIDYIIVLLKELLNNNIIFVDNTKIKLEEIEEITTCLFKTNCDEDSYCTIDNKNGTCSLIIPKNNLLNDSNNEEIYFKRISDEILRYTRIKNYIFYPKQFLSIDNIPYNLTENEIIVLQSSLNQEYFENLKLNKVNVNKYSTYITHDNAIPQLTQKYTSIDDIAKYIRPENKNVCSTEKKANITSKWNKYFDNLYEITFTSDIECSFELIKVIMKNHLNIKDITTSDIKKVLFEEYSKYIHSYKNEILEILAEQGKKKHIRQVQHNQFNFLDFLISESYYITNLDLWLLSLRYKLPIILVSSTVLTENNKDMLMLYRSDSNKYYFVRAPGLQNDFIPKYTLYATKTRVDYQYSYF